MKKFVLIASTMGVLSLPALASAGTIFTAHLTGASERPTPVNTPATGDATFDLTGSAGAWVLSYSIAYSGLTSEPVGGHVHYSIAPPGELPTEQTGPIVHELDSLQSTIVGDWRFDDASNPLSDALVDSLFDQELYVNIHSENFPAGEIRGQIVPGDANVQPVPLPAPLLMTLAGLATAMPFAMKRMRKMA